MRAPPLDATAPAPALAESGVSGLFSSLAATVTLLVLGASLVLGAVAYSRPDVSGLSLIGYAQQPHDPGAWLSSMGFRGGTLLDN